MLSIQLPNIAVQKVSNGYVVQWQRKSDDPKSAARIVRVEAVCKTDDELLATIDVAAKDVALD